MTDYFSLEEKQAVLSALKHIIISDGVVDDAEINYLERLAVTIGFDIDSDFDSKAPDLITSTPILQRMLHQKKVMLSSILIEMAKVDGRIHENEINAINKFIEIMGLD